MTETSYYLPTKPFSATDALNRAAIATGSVRNARISSDADFNGHPATLKWNTFIGSWQAYYSWSGIQYIVRARVSEGMSAAWVVKLCRDFYDRQGRGASFGASLKDAPPEKAEEMRQALLDAGFLPRSVPEDRSWRTWVHDEAFTIVRAEREGLMAPDAPEAYASEAEWREAAYARRREAR